LKSVGFGAASFGALSLVGSSSVSAGKKKRPNIILFPHVAGSMNNECRRMAKYALDDYKRFCSGEKLEHEVTKQQWEYMA
jgi:hypothetical protein